MAYYDRIAKQWHELTGYSGGSFKKLLLNEVLLSRIPDIQDRSILELGAGNGYFMPLVLRRYSGQQPSRVIITDKSQQLLTIAQTHFRIPRAEYRVLDVRAEFPFEDGVFEMIVSTMVLNEVSNGGVRRALSECHRVLSDDGVLLITVAHPLFVNNLAKRGMLRRDRRGALTMPGADGIRLPVVKRSTEMYETMLDQIGFSYEAEDIIPTDKVLNAKPGLRRTGNFPIALVFTCTKH